MTTTTRREPEPESLLRREVRYEHTPEFPRVLHELNASLLVSTYQAGKLCVVGAYEGRLTFAFHNFERVMGVATSPARIAVGARRQIFSLYPAHDCATRLPPVGTHDGCWLARTSFITGNIHGHDLAWGQDGLWVVNTLFSCLCTLHDGFNFVPRWRPPFISELIDQDRCHLNGLALERGQPRFVTAMAESNEPAGWRPTKATSGCVIDVPSSQTVARGLSMPHSPRLHKGRLWVLDSGKGLLTVVDPQSGHVEPVASLPGYTRGLALCGHYAFVGLSRIRETAIFGGVPIAERRDELKCGVGVIDLRTGRHVAALQFHSGVEEIFAVELMLGMQNPYLCGSELEEDSHDVWIVKPMSEPAAGSSPPPMIVSAAPAGQSVPPVNPTATAQALSREAAAFHEQGRVAEARDRVQRAIELSPQSPELHNQLGNLLQDLGETEAALACYRRALELQPAFAPAHQNLGYVLQSQGHTAAALRHFEAAQASHPLPMNRVLMAMALPVIYDSLDDVGDWRQRLSREVRGLVEDGLRIDTANTLIPTSFFLAYQGESDRDVLRDLGRVFQGVECCPAARDGGWRPAGRKIKVGFLSAYFRDHTIGRLNLGRIQRLSRAEFDVTVILAVPPRDELTEQFRQAADRFISVPRQVAAARRQIADLGLDILLFADVGMDALTQTLAHSRMAPIQCATWGHPDTTGSFQMDYFLSSDLLEMPEADEHYTERLVRLPNLGIYYERPKLTAATRSREFFGLDPKRHVYLCPQTLFKFHPAFDAALAGILAADPDGDLVLLDARQPSWTAQLRRRWESTLPDGTRRVRFLPAQPRDEFLHLLAQADVILDPFPFGGGNTSYEALAVGTPVVTCPGRFLRGRITNALFRKMQFVETVVSSAEQYVQLAVRLATEADFRQTMRKDILDASQVLFEDPAEVLSLASGLESLVARQG